MRGTNHPSIIKLLSFSESNDHFFLVLERMCTVIVIRTGGCKHIFLFSHGGWRIVPSNRQANVFQREPFPPRDPTGCSWDPISS